MVDGSSLPANFNPDPTPAPMIQLTLLTKDQEVIACSVQACLLSPVLKSIVEMPRDMLVQMLPIPFDHPSPFLAKVCEYLEKVAKRELPDREILPYFSLCPEEIDFFTVDHELVGLYSMGARMLGSLAFVHVMALTCAVDLRHTPHIGKMMSLGIDPTVPEQLRNKRRNEIGKHILTMLGIYNM